MLAFRFGSLLLLAQVSLATMSRNHSTHPESDKQNHRMLRVLPLPTDYTTGDQTLCLSPDFSIQLEEHSGQHLPDDLKEAAKRTERRLFENTHQLLTPKRGTELFDTEAQEGECKHWLPSLHIVLDSREKHVPSIMDSAIRPAEDRPDLERYSLSVPLDGTATIKAPTALGAFRGLTTFENLFFYLREQDNGMGANEESITDVLAEAGQLALGVATQTVTGHRGKEDRKGIWYAPAAPYEFQDKPAFGWRAVMLDTSRNWFGKEAILKMLDTMSMVKVCLSLLARPIKSNSPG